MKTPTVLHMEAVECGAAALAMVLGYFGKFVPLEQLRKDCGVSRDGINSGDLAKAGEKHGLKVRGFRAEPRALKNKLFPAIVHWNFNHFMVLEGFGRKKVYLNDPASGRRAVSLEEFDLSFTGVILFFETGDDFKKGGRKGSLTGFFLGRLSGFKTALVFALLAGFLMVIPGLAIPVFSRVFVDDILVRGLQSWIIPLLIGMALTAFLRTAMNGLKMHCLMRFQTKLATLESSRFFWHVLRLPILFFTQRFGGEIGSRLSINERVSAFLAKDLINNLIHIFTVLFYCIILFFYDVLLTAIGIGFAFISLVVLVFVNRLRVDKSRILALERGKLVGTAMGGLQTIETLKATGRESDFFEKWSGYLAKYLNSRQGMARLTMPLSVVPPLLMALTNIVVLGLGGVKVMSGEFSMGVLVAYQSLLMSFMEPFGAMASMGASLQGMQGDINRLNDVMEYPIDGAFERTEEEESALSGRILSGELELRNISFGYNRSAPPVIKEFSLHMKPGQRVAVVGASGSGKTTLLRVIAGLFEPWQGETLLDGVPRHQFSRMDLSSSIALVDQDIRLFEGTVKENMTLWDSTISMSNVIAAARDACIHDDIAARAGAYESRVVEMGVNFSGGQRQRIEIARALAQNPSILLLDEATNTLDPATEKQIGDQLRRRACTCLIVAHRLSTIRDCHEIIVLDRGKVVQRGTHEQMKNVEGPYGKLIRIQDENRSEK